jgi:hypothetical protein
VHETSGVGALAGMHVIPFHIMLPWPHYMMNQPEFCAVYSCICKDNDTARDQAQQNTEATPKDDLAPAQH